MLLMQKHEVQFRGGGEGGAGAGAIALAREEIEPETSKFSD